MQGQQRLKVEVVSENDPQYIDIKKTIFELDNQIKILSSKADNVDYFIAIASGILCGMFDAFWTKDFDISRGRDMATEQVNKFVTKVANMMGYEGDDVNKAVLHLEKYNIPADGNTTDFGGGLQHHLRDFVHHPTLVGLIFSILTQFTSMSYGTNTAGMFVVVPVPEKSRIYIGDTIPDKLFKGTIIWFFHLVSDMAGSHNTAGLGGGTGIPGPIISLAKELSVLPGIRDIVIDEKSLSLFLSKIFNGTLFAKHGPDGKILKDTVVKMDFRGELGVINELGRQALPVLANECIVRAFFFIRRLAMEIKNKKIMLFSDTTIIDWDIVKPIHNPTINKMLLIATGVFSTVDLADAIITQKYFVSINYIGIGRFSVAIGSEAVNVLKIRNIKKLKRMYEEIDQYIFTIGNNDYERAQNMVDIEKFGLSMEQTEILYNVELFKTIHDIECTSVPAIGEKIIALKQEWVTEWKNFMSVGFPGFVQDENAELHWLEKEELLKKIEENDPKGVWFRLVLLEAMLFEPYYALSTEKNKKGEDIPSKKYNDLLNPINGYKKNEADKYLDNLFKPYEDGYVKRLRKTYDKVTRELNEVLKNAITSIGIGAIIALTTVTLAGMFAPVIAVALVGSNFVGLNGAALTSACLAYLGGGAVAAGGLGMTGGTMAIVGGGAILGVSVGSGVGGAAGAINLFNKQTAIRQSAKLMVAMREIFLNDEKDIVFSNEVLEQYVSSIATMEKDLVDLRLREEIAGKDEKKELHKQIKALEDPIHAMKIAMRSMNKFNSSFGEGLVTEM